MFKYKIITSHIVVLTSTMMILIAPTELLYKTEKIYYVLCFIPLLLWFLNNGIKIRKDHTICLMLYLFYMIFSSLWSPNPSAISNCFIKCVTISFLFLQLQYSFSEEEYNAIKRIFIIQYIELLAIIIMFHYIDWDGRLWIMHNGLTTDPNSICSWLIFPFIICFEAFIQKKNWIRYIFIFLIFSIIIVLLLLETRTGLFVHLFSIFVIVLYNTRHNIKRHPLKAFTILLLGVVCIFIIFNILPAEFLHRLSNNNTSTLGGRTTIWKQHMQLLLDNPIRIFIGFGEGATTYLTQHVSHNLYLELLFNQGIIGLLLIVFFLFKSIISLSKSENYILIAIIALMIMSASLSEFTSRPVMLGFFLAGAKIKKRTDECSKKE